MRKIIKLYNNFGGLIGVIKTIIFNLRYFPFSTALKLPVWLSSKTRFSCMKKGNIIFDGVPKMGCVRIGVHDHKFVNNLPVLLYVKGKLKVNGSSQITISSGSFVGIGVESLLNFEGFAIIGGECRIVCHHHISIGDECIIQERCLIMDHDTFEIVDKNSECINPPEKIKLGRNVWVQPGSIIKSGVSLCDNSIIKSGTIVTNIDYYKCDNDMSIEIMSPSSCERCINGRKTWRVNFNPISQLSHSE